MSVQLPPFEPTRARPIRYGDNPQQQAAIIPLDTDDPLALWRFDHLHGPALSHTNWLDADVALEVLCQIGAAEPACVVVKHAIPCGAAVADDVAGAFQRAWDGDSLAAFGGVIAINRRVDEALADLLLADRRVVRGLLAAEIAEGAQRRFARRANLWVLANPALAAPRQRSGWEWRTVRGMLLAQERYDGELQTDQVEVVSRREPTESEWRDLRFAWSLVVATRSNAVTIVRDRQLVGSGAGQQDRLRTTQIAVEKAGDRAGGAVAASDGYFPFAFGDAPEALLRAGATAIVQPPGSRSDGGVIQLADSYGAALVFTRGVRGFRH